jgi:NAD(P)-dependent dehydrogenase (short-subunit alcohol dehydrogenase family)
VAGRLDGEIAIVTGAARGIGAAIVERFRSEGAAVLGTDVLDGADVRLNVASEADWARAVEHCRATLDAPTVLVNNAGVARFEGVEEETLEGWRAVLDVNLTGVFLGMRAVLPAMRAQRRGAIVNVSSIWGVVGTAGAAAYHASKGGVTVLTKNAAVTYAADGIRVNSIHPGQVRTPMTEASGTEPFVVARTPLGRAAVPAEIAAVAVFLASRESSFVTGAAVAADGGYLAQ